MPAGLYGSGMHAALKSSRKSDALDLAYDPKTGSLSFSTAVSIRILDRKTAFGYQVSAVGPIVVIRDSQSSTLKRYIAFQSNPFH